MEDEKEFLALAVRDLRICVREDEKIVDYLKAGRPISLDRYIYRFTPTSYGIWMIWVADCMRRAEVERIGLFDGRSGEMAFGSGEELEESWQKFMAETVDPLYVMNLIHVLEAWPMDTMFSMTHRTADGVRTERVSRDIIDDIPEDRMGRILRIEKDGSVLIDRKAFEEQLSLRRLEDEGNL